LVWFTLVGALVATRWNPPILALIHLILVMMAMSLSVYSFNDLSDVEMDKNHPTKWQRALASGQVTAGQVLSLSLVSGIIALSLSLLSNVTTFLICAIYLGLGIVYSQKPIRLKEKFILKEGITAIGVLLAFFVGGSIVGTVPLIVQITGSMMTLLMFAVYPLFYDDEDADIDRAYGCKTLTMVLSLERKVELAIAFILTIMTLITFTYAQFGFSVIAPVVICSMCLLFLRYLYPLLGSPDTKRMLMAKKVYRLLGLTMSLGFILGVIVL
jgi:4-hydroxybenzoate polyprenyltransferase